MWEKYLAKSYKNICVRVIIKRQKQKKNKKTKKKKYIPETSLDTHINRQENLSTMRKDRDFRTKKLSKRVGRSLLICNLHAWESTYVPKFSVIIQLKHSSCLIC